MLKDVNIELDDWKAERRRKNTACPIGGTNLNLNISRNQLQKLWKYW
jgi:hypothetical protein